MIARSQRFFARFENVALVAAVMLLSCVRDVYAEDGWFRFEPAPDPFRESAIDLRFLNERLAGDGGFIRVKDGQFAHTRTGEPVRFWAVNGPPSSAKSREELRRVARALAKRGVNLVRIHSAMFDDRGEPDVAKVRRALEIVEEMKAEGIYTHLSIYFPLWLRPKPGTAWIEGYDGAKHPFATLFFDHGFQEQYRKWWTLLLSTRSEGTGRTLVDEPAVMGLEILNEDSLFFWTFNETNLPEPQLERVEVQFGVWLKHRYGSVEAALTHWGGRQLKRDNPTAGRVAIRPLWNIFNEKTPRDQDTARFLFEAQTAFYRDTYQFLRQLGFKGVITASNWATASPEVFGPLEKLSYASGDFIDRHGYFSCEHKGKDAEWSIREGHTYTDRSALRFDGSIPGKPKSFVHPAIDPNYNGLPSMISETTFNRPNRFRSEAPLFYATYGALQDTDAIVHFALDGADWSVKPGFWMQPWTLMAPAMMGQFPAAALIFRQGLIAPGETLAKVWLNTNDLFALKGTPLPEDAAFDELRAKDLPQGNEVRPGQRLDPLIHFAGQTKVKFGAEPSRVELSDLKGLINRKAQTVRSSRGDLALDYNRGVLTINSSKAQGVSGALRGAGLVETADLIISSDLDLGHIVAVPLDGQPISTSRKILLQIMSEEQPSGFATEPSTNGVKRIVKIGQNPWLVREFNGTVKFKRADAASLRVTALDANGYPLGTTVGASNVDLRKDVLYYVIGD